MNSPGAVAWLVAAALLFAAAVYVFGMAVEQRAERQHGPKHPDVEQARSTEPPPADAIVDWEPVYDQALDTDDWRRWERQVSS